MYGNHCKIVETLTGFKQSRDGNDLQVSAHKGTIEVTNFSSMHLEQILDALEEIDGCQWWCILYGTFTHPVVVEFGSCNVTSIPGHHSVLKDVVSVQRETGESSLQVPRNSFIAITRDCLKHVKQQIVLPADVRMRVKDSKVNFAIYVDPDPIKRESRTREQHSFSCRVFVYSVTITLLFCFLALQWS